MWRIIIRISYDNDGTSKLRNRIVPILKECGIELNPNTGTFEGTQVGRTQAAKQLSKVLEVLARPQFFGVKSASLDHFWVYIDRVPSEMQQIEIIQPRRAHDLPPPH